MIDRDGKEILLFKDEVLIGGATTHSVSRSTNMRNRRHKRSGEGPRRNTTDQDWQITCEGLVAYDANNGVKELKQAWRESERIKVKSELDDESGEYEVGYGYISSLDSDYPQDDNATWSVTIDGDSDLVSLEKIEGSTEVFDESEEIFDASSEIYGTLNLIE